MTISHGRPGPGYQMAPPTDYDHVAPEMIRDWDQAKRARIRELLLVLGGEPEMKVVAMIDKEAQLCQPR